MRGTGTGERLECDVHDNLPTEIEAAKSYLLCGWDYPAGVHPAALHLPQHTRRMNQHSMIQKGCAGLASCAPQFVLHFVCHLRPILK